MSLFHFPFPPPRNWTETFENRNSQTLHSSIPRLLPFISGQAWKKIPKKTFWIFEAESISPPKPEEGKTISQERKLILQSPHVETHLCFQKNISTSGKLLGAENWPWISFSLPFRSSAFAKESSVVSLLDGGRKTFLDSVAHFAFPNNDTATQKAIQT